MIEISSLTALIVAEVLVGLVILSGLLVLFALLRKGRIRKAANHLAERVQADKSNRSERLKALLADGYHLQSPLLDQTLHGIVQSEMTLYQNMLNGFLKDDQVSLQQIDVDVENLVLSYQSLGGLVSKSGSPAEGGSEEIDHLKAENERLSEELKVTMDTMGRMLNEYSTMFADGTDEFKDAVSQTQEDKVPESVQPELAEEATVEVETGAEANTEVETEAEANTEVETEAEAETPPSVEDDNVGDDMFIPDMTEQELTESSLSDSEEFSGADVDELIASVENTSAAVDEEVSEIIDEVMEIADDMIHESELAEETEESKSASVSESSPESTEQQEQAGESMMDDLNNIDIDIPDVADVDVEESDLEPGSLEEEWAKLLEEESSPDEEKKDA
ncbi:MAG: hypothetical protein ABW158_18690 [Candidatus Thiodiazotropha sp. 6PDIVS]